MVNKKLHSWMNWTFSASIFALICRMLFADIDAINEYLSKLYQTKIKTNQPEQPIPINTNICA